MVIQASILVYLNKGYLGIMPAVQLRLLKARHVGQLSPFLL